MQMATAKTCLCCHSDSVSSEAIHRIPSVQDVMNWGVSGASTNKRNSSFSFASQQRSSATPAMHGSASGARKRRLSESLSLDVPDVGSAASVSGDQMASLLVLYCGGTIGMRCKNGVYVPEPNYLVHELRRLPILHDQNFAATHLTDGPESHMILAMPLSKEGKRILYSVREYDPLLDSSNMTYDDYARLANDIMMNYTKYDGFVILHGTDTMAYTASALSFMLENLGKPVILTGSQIPIFEARSDGLHNFMSTMILAANYNIPEVAIYFDSVLLRGNRSTKVDNVAFEAFASPNMDPLANVGVTVKVNWEAVYRHRGLKKFSVHTGMCRNVGVLRLFPGITEITVRAFLQPPMEGVVLQTYGQGNWPTARADLMAVLKEACDRGVIIINTTQCARGIVSPIYACGKELLDIGVIAGSDMTVEAALMKLSYILSKEEWTLEEKREKIGETLRGEMTAVVAEDHRILHFSLIETLADTMRLSTSEEIQLLREAVFPYLLCAAAREGSIDALERLRQAGAQFQMSDYDGRTALHVACCEGHTVVVQYLLDLGAPVHLRDRYGDSPLDDAVTFHRTEIVKMLRQTGAHLTMSPNRIATTLCNVVVSEDAEALEAWWVAGADLNTSDYSKRTALHIAAANGRLEHVKMLLTHGANPNFADIDGRTPLLEAVENKHHDVVSILEPLTTNGVNPAN